MNKSTMYLVMEYNSSIFISDAPICPVLGVLLTSYRAALDYIWISNTVR